MGRVISTAIQFIDGFTKPSKQVIQNMRQMGKEALEAGKQIQNAGKTIANAGAALTKAVTLPIAGVATAAAKTAADFEASMSKVGAITGAVADDEISGIIQKAGEMGLSFKEGIDTTETAMNILKAKAQQMGATTSFSASESAEAMQYMAMAGWKTADMMDGITGIMNLAAASGEDLATTSDIVTDALTAFGLTAKDSGHFADVLAAASSNANTNVSMMGETFKYCAPIAGALGFSVEDTAGAIGLMANAGIKSTQAGTSLRTIMNNLAGEVKISGRELGNVIIQTTNIDGSMRMLSDILTDCRGAFEKLSESEKASAAESLVGKNAMSGFLALMNAAPADIAKLDGAIQGASSGSGAAAEMAGKMLDNLNGQLTLLKSAVEGIAITIGNKLMPYVKTAVSWVQKVADYINNLNDAQLDNIIKWAGIAAAIGPTVMIFGKIVTTVGTAIKMFGTITKTIANFGGIMGVITSPAGIVIMVLAGIAAAAVLIIKNWDKVKETISKVGGWFKDAFDKAGVSTEGFRNTFKSIGDTIGTIADTIGGIIKGIAGIFKDEFGAGVSESMAQAGDGLWNAAVWMIGAFDVIVKAVDNGLKAFGALLDFFRDAFQGNWENAAQGVRDSIQNIFPKNIADDITVVFDRILPVVSAAVEGIKSAFNGLVQDAKSIFEDFKNIFGGIGTFFKGIFNGDVDKAFEGFKTAAGSAADAVGNIFKTKLNAAKNFMKGALSTFLPQETINKIAGVFDAAADGWDAAINAVKGSIDGFVQAVRPLVDDVKIVFDGISQFLKGVFAGDWKGAFEGLKTSAGGAISGVANIIKMPFTVISGAVKGVINNFKGFDIVKTVLNSVKDTIKGALEKCGVNVEKFGANLANIKNRIGSILNNLKSIFSGAFSAILKPVRAAAVFIAGIFGKKVDDTCSTAGEVLIAFKETAGAVFGAVVKQIKGAMDIIVPVVKVAFSVIGETVAAVVDSIVSIISGLMTVFDGITTFLSGVFTGDWSKAWEGVKTIFKGVFESFEALCKMPVNAVIGIINGAISGINKLGLTIPEWVPVIGGNSFSLDIPAIPLLYKGTSSWMGGAAVIHDRGGEIVDLPRGSRVYPHDKSLEMARREGASQGTAGSIVVNVQKLADKLEVRSDRDIDRIAEALAVKLKKIALNTGTA